MWQEIVVIPGNNICQDHILIHYIRSIVLIDLSI